MALSRAQTGVKAARHDRFFFATGMALVALTALSGCLTLGLTFAQEGQAAIQALLGWAS
jgi:hypothetical protein